MLMILPMPQFAWQMLIRELMTEAEIQSQEKLAEAITIHSQTVSRWFSKKPSAPSAKSIRKVAAFAGLSEGELRWRWSQHMRHRYAQYDSNKGTENVREDASTPAGLDVLAEARALAELDLREVVPEQAPSLHQMRDRMSQLADAGETVIAALRSLVASYAAVYEGARDSARRLKRSVDD